MKNRFTMAAAVLAALMAASPVLAEDARSDEAIRLSTDQTEYNPSMARWLRVLQPGAPSTLHAADNNAKALRQRIVPPPFPGG